MFNMIIADLLKVMGQFIKELKMEKFISFEKLSKKNMELYINIENENKDQDSDIPEIEKRVIKLNNNIPEDEDFGL